MASVYIDIPGIGSVEAKNAATESTLRELVNAMKGMQKGSDKDKGGKANKEEFDPKNIKDFNKQTKDAVKNSSESNKQTKATNESFKHLADAGRAAGNFVGKFGQAAGMAGRSVDILGSRMMSAAEGTADMISQLSRVGDSLSSAAAVTAKIPIIGGVLSSVFGAVADASEKVLASYQESASVGATFGGSVNDMARAASGAGMTLEKFAGMLKSNGEALMLLGGTTEEGAKRFSNLSKSMQQSGLTSELNRMGYSTAQVNEGILKYSSLMGKTGALSRMSTDQIAKGSASYMKELDALAKITGQTREAKQQEMDALMAEGKVRAAMAGIEDPEQQKKMMAYITSFPKEAQGAIADMIATGSMTTDEAVKFAALMPKAAEQAMSFGRTLQNGGKITDQNFNNARNVAISEAKESVKRNKQLGQFSEEYGRTYVGVANLASQEINGYSKAIGEQGKATAKANLAEQLEGAKRKLADFSNSFTMFLANSGLLDALMSSFQAVASFAQAVLLPVFTMFSTAINMLIPVIQNVILPAFTILGNWIQNAVIPIFQQAWQIVSDFTVGLLDFFGITTAASDGLGAFEEVLYTVSEFVEDNLTPILGVLGVMVASSLIPKMIAMIMPMVSMATTVLSVTASLLKFGAQLVWSTLKFIAMNIPLLKLTLVVGLVMAAFKGIQWVMSKFGLDMSMLSDIFKYVGTMFETLWLKLKQGIFGLLNKIPGMRGDFDDDLKEIGKQLEEQEKKREEIEKNLAEKRKKNLDDEKKKDDAAAKQEEAADKAQTDKEEKRALAKDARQKRREEEAHKKTMGGIEEKNEAEKKAGEKDADTSDMKVDLSDPLQQLRTFAEKNKSAYSQEAKAIDDKERARNELAMASDQYTAAMKSAANAKTKEEKEIAEQNVKAAEERVKMAQDAQVAADKKVSEAAERMKAAKEGKDPGAKKKEEKATEGKREAEGRPSEGQQPVTKSGDMANYLKTIALLESGGDANAKAKTSSAGGMFQFIDSTWKQMTKEMGKDYSLQDKFDPKKAEEVAAYFSSKQKGQLEKGIGREASSTDMYMSHFLGAGGATKFLNAMGKDPKQSAAALDPAAAKANKSIYYNKEGKERTVEEVYALMDKKVKSAEGRVASGKVTDTITAIGSNMGKTNNVQLAASKVPSGGATPSSTQVAAATGKDKKSDAAPTSTQVAAATGKNQAEDQKKADEKAKKEQETALAAAEKQGPSKLDKAPGPAQESAETLLAQLNMKMDTLIAVSRTTADLNDRQLSTQQNMVGNLFA